MVVYLTIYGYLFLWQQGLASPNPRPAEQDADNSAFGDPEHHSKTIEIQRIFRK